MVVLTRSYLASDWSVVRADENTPLDVAYGLPATVPTLQVTLANPSTTDWIEATALATIPSASAKSVSLDWDFDDSFMNCIAGHGHFDGIVTAARVSGLTATAAWDPDFSHLTLALSGTAPTPLTSTIVGSFTVQPANGGISDHCTTGADYDVYTYTPSTPNQMYGSSTGWFNTMGPFTLNEKTWSGADSQTIYWHLTRTSYDKNGNQIGQSDVGDFVVGYASMSLKITTP